MDLEKAKASDMSDMMVRNSERAELPEPRKENKPLALSHDLRQRCTAHRRDKPLIVNLFNLIITN